MKIYDRAKIVGGFQTSVNIDFDLSSPEKIRGYVPTSDVCEVLGHLFESIIDNTDQATFLVGPYGKGKSFLILTLLQILSQKASEEAKEVFVRKVEIIRPDLAKRLRSFIAEDAKCLPVVINSDYDNLKQSFMVALKTALADAGLEDLVPASSFDQCVSILDAWTKDKSSIKNALLECGKNANLEKLRIELKSYSQEAYEQFVDLYNCVTIGQQFNPLVNEDVPKLFAEVSAEIRKRGYSGIFVVFDEFSKFLESSSKKLGDDLKFIQDFAEKCTRSDHHYSLHLCCVAHKPITQYGDNSRVDDLLTTVNGRFTTLRFQRGMKENMELIANAIEKSPTYSEFFEELYNRKRDFFDGIEAMRLLEQGEDFKEFAKGCYPLNPLGAYCLVRTSELVAQNERTLFTFINGNDATGLKRLLNRDDYDLISVPAIYDYFCDLFKNDPSQYIKDVCYLADAALRETEDLAEQDIIKTIAVFRIIDDPRILKATRETVALALGKEKQEIAAQLNSLIRMSVVRQAETDGSLDFSFAGSKEINDRAELLLKKELRSFKPVKWLNELAKADCYYPREYNSRNRIVRFSRFVYIEADSFLKLPRFVFPEREGCDLLFVRILGADIDAQAIFEKTRTINDGGVIVEVPGAYRHDSLIKLLKYHTAYDRMANDFREKDGSSFKAVSSLLDECKTEIGNLIKDGFGQGKSRYFYRGEEITVGATTNINRIFEERFHNSPIVNNEMVNRHNVSPQYRKTRNDLVDFILDFGTDQKKWSKTYSETSGQNTLWRVFVDNIYTGEYRIFPIITMLNARLAEGGERIVVKDIVDELTDAPYGLRRGVIPLFLGMAISRLNSLDDSVVALYFRRKEIRLDALNLEKAIDGKRGDYVFAVNGGATSRGEYVGKIIKTLGGEAKASSSSNLAYAVELMKAWFRNLPEIVRTATTNDYPGIIEHNEQDLLAELLKYDTNPTDFLFDFLPNLFETETLEDTLVAFERTKENIEALSEAIAMQTVAEVAQTMGLPQGNLLSGFKSYLNARGYRRDTIVGNRVFAQVADLVMESKSFDDSTFLHELSDALLEAHFEDWHAGTKKSFLERLASWKEYFENSYAPSDADPLQEMVKQTMERDEKTVSPMASLLENSVRTAIKQFGQSVSEEDIKLVLVRVLTNLRG